MKYYVNKNAQSNGDHEVHTQNCSWLPSIENRIYLGEFIGCKGAIFEAKRKYFQSNGCYFCSNQCHTG